MNGDKVETQRDSSSLTSEKFLLKTRKEVAEMCRVSVKTVDRDRKDGKLVSTELRGRVLFTQKAIDKWLKNRSRNVS